MHTTEKLAIALDEAGLSEMAKKARAGYYHDYLSPLATPCLQLERDLREAGTPAAIALKARHINGEFDATVEEGKAWMESADGKEVMSHLSPEMRKVIIGN